jgi:hypothetical protein
LLCFEKSSGFALESFFLGSIASAVMRDSTLIRISLSVALLGLLGLLLYANRVPPVSSDTSQLNREIMLTGRVARVGEYGKVAYIELEHLKITDVVVFRPGNIPFAENDTVQVTGVMETYQGQEQMVAYRISSLTQ